MPFLRRRGVMASESDMARHHRPRPASPSEHPAAAPDDNLASRDSVSVSDRSSTSASRLAPTRTRSNQSGPANNHDDESVPRQRNGESSEHHRPDTPPIQDQTSKHRRFSILRFRNASDSQLSLRAKQQAETPPPLPRPPEIITTAPTEDFQGPKKKSSRMSLFRRSNDIPREEASTSRFHSQRSLRKSLNDNRPSLAALEEGHAPMPAVVQAQSSGETGSLATPTQRQSESSRSDASSTERTSPSITPKRSQPNNSFFRLRRAKKAPEPLFPLTHLPQKGQTLQPTASSTSLGTSSNTRPPSANSCAPSRNAPDKSEGSQRNRASPAAALLAGTTGTRSGHSSPTRSNLRGRSSTMSSMGRDSTDDHLLPPTTRTSSSTGRKSFGDLFGLSKLRQSSDANQAGSITPLTPGSNGSKSNSLQLVRESISLPERCEDESPAKYLVRVEDAISRSLIAAMLSKSADTFSAAVLRSYMRTFSFFGDPMDMALRKLLMEAELPKETQHIDRCLQAFANRYHECNPGIYSSPDQAYFLAFSLLILHTDVFNKNNKHKMQKADYLKNTHGEGVCDEVLECFYDNITYTPFIHVDDDELDLHGDRVVMSKTKRKPLLSAGNADPAKRAAKEPIDPYTLIIDGDLDALRPNLKDAMPLEDSYNYLGSAESFNLKDLQKTFFRTGILQIVSARSRPDAFMSDQTANNPDEAQAGIVDIKVTKVGVLWRKDLKKRKTRSKWQEWGAILTGAQLYFFRNTSWVKNLMHQFESHIKAGHDGIPIIFKPPLEEFKPDALMSTHGAVALQDTDYKKHKHAFVYVRQGGLDEVLLADNESEMNDWLAKLNYAAAFRTSGVRMRGVVGAHYDGQGRRGMRRVEGSEGTQLVQTPTGPVSIARGRIDRKMADDIQAARRDIMQTKIGEIDDRLVAAQQQLEAQLRNARHLQILAPIQPRTRDQLLSGAARMAAQLKWTRMEIWKERCHRDLLAQDLEEDHSTPDATTASSKSPGDHPPTEREASPTPKASSSRRETNSKGHKGNERRPHSPLDTAAANARKLSGLPSDLESPADQVFSTPPQSAIRSRHGSCDTPHSMLDLDAGNSRRESVSSVAASPSPSPASATAAQSLSRLEENKDIRSESRHSHDEVDAEERNLLKHAGLIQSGAATGSNDNITSTSPPGSSDQGPPVDRESSDRTKIRRSLQRTLRDGAGHLSHHRSRRGKESNASADAKDEQRESMLSRGTGSFVVHGKKASVIDLGTELQSISNEEKLRGRRSIRQSLHGASPLIGTEVDEDPEAVAEYQPTVVEKKERCESGASGSTATARSFRELHRKYSSAQAARSVSAGGRLVVPSDGESEAALSFSDGRRSPLPPIEGDEAEATGLGLTEQLDNQRHYEQSSDDDKDDVEASEGECEDDSVDAPGKMGHEGGGGASLKKQGSVQAVNA